MPPGVGNDRDSVIVDLYHFLDALHARDFGFVEAFQFAAEHRAVLDCRVQHPRQFDVDAIGHLASGLVRGIEPFERFAGKLPVLWIL